MSRLLLVNPNTNAGTTAMMLALARDEAGTRAGVEGLTAARGSALIVDEPSLAVAAQAVVEALDACPVGGFDGVIVAAFGDPGLEQARTRLTLPVTGIAEAGMAEAAAGGRQFAVVTTTPDLADAIAVRARRYGHGSSYAGIVLTPGDPAALTAEPERLSTALEEACHRAVAELGVAALVIGGGPLAAAARRLSGRLPVPLVEPVPAAVRLALMRAVQ